MKYLYTLSALCLLALAACKKESGNPEATAVIIEKGPAGQNTYVAMVEYPEASIFSFLCTLLPDDPRPTYSCINYIYIRNLPANMTKTGTRIRFTKWTDYEQPAIFSSINHAHELEIKDISLAE